MAIITSITTQKRKNRVNIYLDGKFFCGLEKLTAVSHGLLEGKSVSEEELAKIQQESESSVAFEKAATYIATRMRSEKEIVTYLSGKGFLPQVVENCLQKLKEYGYVNDRTFAEELLRSYPSLGRSAIKRKLAEKGISQIIINEVVCDDNFENEEENATALAAKFIKTRANAKNLSQKLKNHLISKGYSFEIANKVARKLIKEEEYYDN